uniref:NARG2_C domain-containing protein n=1 Tax=Syphacia muris TaxID=451379 RepID=A0A0N5AUX9_9BILA
MMSATLKTNSCYSWFVRPESQCPFQQDSDLTINDALKHNQLFCDYCVRTRIHQLTGGEDAIFRGDFPWKNGETKVDSVNESGEEVKNIKKKSRVTKRSSDITQLPDGLIIKAYLNQGLTKDEALRKLVQEKREKAKTLKKPDEDMEKVKTDFNQMPYIPPIAFPNKISLYPNVSDHQRYVAIASNFLNAVPKFRFESNKAELKCMDEALSDERKEFQTLVRRKLNTKKGNPFTFEDFDATRFVLYLKARVFYFWARINRRRMRLHGKYMFVSTVPMSPSIDVGKPFYLNVKNVLHSGRLRKINDPNEKRLFKFSTNAKEISERFSLDEVDKYPIMDDDTALSLALENDIELIAGAGSLMKLMCTSSFTDAPQHLVPVEVKRVYNKHKGEAAIVRIIGKPVVDGLLNPVTVWYKYVKYAVKRSLYPEVKESRKTGGRQRTVVQQRKQSCQPVNVNDILKGFVSDGENELMIDTSEVNNSDDNNETLLSHDTQLNSRQEGTSSILKSADSANGGTLNENILGDVIGGIMKEMGISNDSIATIAHTFESSEMNAKHHTDSGDIRKKYTIFSFDEGNDNICDILVRSNNDGLSSDGTPIIISNKIEYAADYGAEQLTNEWILREILKCKLKGVHDLVRYRIHYNQLFLLQKEKAIENKLIQKVTNGKLLLMEAYGRLKAVIQKIQSLQEGRYVLRCDKNTVKFTDIDFDAPWNSNVTKNMPSLDSLFNGIDEHCVLVYHTVRRQIPAAFPHSMAGKSKIKKDGFKTVKDLSQVSRNARRKYARKMGRLKGKQQKDKM